MMKYSLLYVILALFVLQSCVIPESNHVEPEYHLLTKSIADENKSRALPMVSFHIREVSLPPYLDDNRLVRRTDNSTIKYLENHRWGEPFGEGISRVVGLNLAEMFSTLLYSSYPQRPKIGCNYEIGISLERFEVTGSDNVIISAIVDIFHKSKPVSNFYFNRSIWIEGKSVHDETQALSFALSMISAEVAKTIHSFPLSQALRIRCKDLSFKEQNLEQSLAIVEDLLTDHSSSTEQLSVHFKNFDGSTNPNVLSFETNSEFLIDVINTIGDKFGATVSFTATDIIFTPVR